MVKYSASRYIIKISMCATKYIYRLNLYRSHIKIKCSKILEIRTIVFKPVEWSVLYMVKLYIYIYIHTHTHTHSVTSVHELNPFLEAVREPKCS
jgi:hypothetical protein